MSEAIIEIKDLSKRFETKEGAVDALKNISLTIHKGDIYGIIGMSGAGKSTLVRCLNFLEKPTSGTVTVEGEELSSLDHRQLRKKRTGIGMIFQSFNLLMQRSVIDNVCFPLEIAGENKKNARKRAAELLEVVGLSDKQSAYPAQLSGGQQQRVAIARALATNPRILLCDEATSALDPNTTKSILELLRDINQKYGITIVIITHSMSVVEEVCTHVAIIDNGNLAESGRVTDVFAHPKSEAGKALVLRDSRTADGMKEGRPIRIAFVSNSSYEPVIANLVLEFKTPVNIMYANTKDVEGIAAGEMLLTLPEDKTIGDRMIQYLKDRGLDVEEI
ncbi:MAG: ATP-binding cassette domain-containing protein [Lachnospiraceae bacterium]|nr:ATP-binding cassette domain-containing protein [Lachnospiraceae bacterium]